LRLSNTFAPKSHKAYDTKNNLPFLIFLSSFLASYHCLLFLSSSLPCLHFLLKFFFFPIPFPFIFSYYIFSLISISFLSIPSSFLSFSLVSIYVIKFFPSFLSFIFTKRNSFLSFLLYFHFPSFVLFPLIPCISTILRNAHGSTCILTLCSAFQSLYLFPRSNYSNQSDSRRHLTVGGASESISFASPLFLTNRRKEDDVNHCRNHLSPASRVRCLFKNCHQSSSA